MTENFKVFIEIWVVYLKKIKENYSTKIFAWNNFILRFFWSDKYVRFFSFIIFLKIYWGFQIESTLWSGLVLSSPRIDLVFSNKQEVMTRNSLRVTHLRGMCIFRTSDSETLLPRMYLIKRSWIRTPDELVPDPQAL